MAREEPAAPRGGEEVRSDVMSAPGPPDLELHRDRREHGGAADRLDDDMLAQRAAQERVDAGLADYDADSVPPATDDPVPVDLTETDAYREGAEAVERQAAEGLLPTGERPDFPPSSYPEQ